MEFVELMLYGVIFADAAMIVIAAYKEKDKLLIYSCIVMSVAWGLLTILHAIQGKSFGIALFNTVMWAYNAYNAAQ